MDAPEWWGHFQEIKKNQIALGGKITAYFR
jgi:hypothetical protein